MDRLRAIIARVQLFYDPTREPLRRRVYTALTVILGVAVTLGAVTGTMAATLTGVAPVLLMIPAAEAARRHVTPTADPIVDDEPGRHAADREVTV